MVSDCLYPLLKFFAVMVADNKFHNCLLHISMNAVHMVKSLIALRILRALTRDGTDKFIRKRNGIFHNILRIAGVNTLSLHRKRRACRVETLVAHIAKLSAVNRVSIIRVKSINVKKCHTVSRHVIMTLSKPPDHW